MGADEHEGHVDRLMCKVKDRTICDYHNMTYNKCPKLVVVSYLEANITWLNVLPKKNVIYKTLSTSEIVLLTPKIDATHATLQPGSYAHYKIKAKITNNTEIRSVAAMTLIRSN